MKPGRKPGARKGRQVNLYLPPALYDRYAARADQINLSALMQEALTKRLDEIESAAVRYERALAWLVEQ